MHLVFHIGVHATDNDKMLKSLLNNRDWLHQHGTEVIPPSRHRGMFEEALMALNGGRATHEMEQIMLDAMLATEHPERVVFSTQTFMGAPGRAVGKDGFYPQIGSRVAALANLFPTAECEFFAALRNPATLLAEVLEQFQGGGYDKLMQGRQPHDLRWRDPVHRLVRAAQGRRVVLWCHEDAPLIWPELIRLIGDMPPEAPLHGALVFMQELLGDAGMAQLRSALGGRDHVSIAERRRLYAEMLETHALPGAMDLTVDLPGWTQDLVDEVTENYRRDVAEIAVMPGVEFVLP